MKPSSLEKWSFYAFVLSLAAIAIAAFIINILPKLTHLFGR